jgi:nitrogen fixation NifU-like protein
MPQVNMNDNADRDTILDHARDPFHHGPCPRTTHFGQFSNPSCGDTSRVELRLNEANRIEEVWFQSQGCMINLAGGSMLVEFLQGKLLDDAMRLTKEDVLALLDSPLTPRRQLCFLISYFALRSALDSSPSRISANQ